MYKHTCMYIYKDKGVYVEIRDECVPSCIVWKACVQSVETKIILKINNFFLRKTISYMKVCAIDVVE